MDLKKRTILTEDFVLKAVRPVAEDCGAPSWALGAVVFKHFLFFFTDVSDK